MIFIHIFATQSELSMTTHVSGVNNLETKNIFQYKRIICHKRQKFLIQNPKSGKENV